MKRIRISIATHKIKNNSMADGYREKNIFCVCFSNVRIWKQMTPGMGLLLTGAFIDTRENKRCGYYSFSSPWTISVVGATLIVHRGQLALRSLRLFFTVDN